MNASLAAVTADDSSTPASGAVSRRLPSARQLRQGLPVDTALGTRIAAQRQAVRDILNGEDDRLLIVTGPCPLHDPDAARGSGARRARPATRPTAPHHPAPARAQRPVPPPPDGGRVRVGSGRAAPRDAPPGRGTARPPRPARAPLAPTTTVRTTPAVRCAVVTGSTGVESLSRRDRPHCGTMPPGLVVVRAERGGLIEPLAR